MSDWRPSQDRDQAICAWLEAQGIKVTSNHYYFSEEAYSWRDDTPRPTLTLTVSQHALEDFTPAQLIAALDSLRVAEAMRRDPRGRAALVVKSGVLVVTSWP